MMTRRGFTLIEMQVYLAALIVILTVAYPAFARALRASRDLRSNADDIVRALHAGEHWRRDIRSATAPIDGATDQLIISQPTGNVVYVFAGNTVWRETVGERVAFLSGVKSSVMQADVREHATAWRWEIELTTRQPQPRVQPLFSFAAVAGGRP